MCFYETLHVFVFCCCYCFAWRVRRLWFLVYHVAFSSFSQGKCFSSLKFRVFIWWMFFFFSWWQNISPRETLDQQYNHDELLFDKAIFIDNFWGSVAFEKLLNFFGLLSYRNCKFWRAFWRALRLLLNRALLTSIFSFFKSFKYPPNCLELIKAKLRWVFLYTTCYSNNLLVSLKRQLSFELPWL